MGAKNVGDILRMKMENVLDVLWVGPYSFIYIWILRLIFWMGDHESPFCRIVLGMHSFE